jgi:hypothetical protein
VAREWYASRHDRAQVLDDHAEVIYEQFGDADLRFGAAVDIRTGRPSLLIISIFGARRRRGCVGKASGRPGATPGTRSSNA